MGAWGHKPFENDAALDWLNDLDEGTLRRALTKIVEVDAYIDVDDGSAAVAAAELVAAAGDGTIDRIPKGARAWLAEHGKQVTAADRALALRAIDRVLDPKCELAGLWDEGGADNEWRRDVAALRARL